MVINLGAALAMARLLAPSEYGVTVLGSAIFAIAEALRALGGGAYLIQQRELSPDNIRTCFTVSLLATLVVTTALSVLAGPLSAYFGVPHLERYMQVSALGYLMGPFIYPISAMMSRKMAFGALAAIGVLTASVNAIVSVYLATRGFSYMSFAWASAISTAAGMLFYLHYWKDWSIFRPVLREWRSVIGFSVYDSATGVLSQIADSLPYFIFGRLFNAEAVGLCQRAVMLCLVPERVILAGVGAVALPAFSQQTREGRSLKNDYLRAIELITAAQWPALLILVLLANPIVSLLLGTQWLAAVPFVQILATALLFSFPLTLYYATIVAVGAIKYMPVVVVLQSIASIALLTAAARHGLHAAALSTLVILPCNGLLSLLIVRHFVGFRWVDVGTALRRSVISSVLSAVGPAAMLIASGKANLSIMGMLIALLLSAVGWIFGLRLTHHPLLQEMLRVIESLRKTATAIRLAQVGTRLFGR